MKIYNSVAELVGKTPLLRLGNLEKKYALSAKLYAKVEFFNPAGSVKDRVALEMISQYEKSGKLSKDSVLIEPTSGNTGIGIAALCAAKGYRAIIVMPDTMSKERRMLMTAYGAELVLTDGSLGMAGAIARAEELEKQIPGAIIAGQFTNPANPDAHYKTTGPEIWQDTDGEVDIFLACAGTGGTVSGTGRFLKEKNPCVRVVAVEPADSPVLTKGKSGAHKLQGMGAGFIPKVLDTSVYDQVYTVTTDDAYATARMLYATEHLLCGISSGAALWVATQVAKEPANEGKTIVVLLPDTGERYRSVPGFLD